MSFAPTPEQQTAIDLAAQPGNLVCQALAGAGKTTTLVAIAESMPQKQFLMLAFNKSIVNDIGPLLPRNATARTTHSLAFGAVGSKYKRRIGGGARMKNTEVAKRLGIDAFHYAVNGQERRLAPGFLASKVMTAVGLFASSADTEITAKHFAYIDGIDLPDDNGRRGHANNRELVKRLVPAARRMWDDVVDVNGTLPFTHDYYLKIWALGSPRINADVILVDEAQDLSGVFLGVLACQPATTKIVLVGDANQQIYEWRGAVDALAKFEATGTAVAWLTTSFRFGPEIAAVANQVLNTIEGNRAQVVGLAGKESSVGELLNFDAYITRTNAEAVRFSLSAMKDGKRVALVGGADEITRFAKGAQELQVNGFTANPQLACFSSWNEVIQYVDECEDAADLLSLVRLVEDYSPDVLIDGLGRCVNEDMADVVVTTAHRSKGRQFNRVKIAGDFRDPTKSLTQALDPAELRLLYVAVTRAKQVLDVTSCPFFRWLNAQTPTAPGVDVTVTETGDTFTAVVSAPTFNESAEGRSPLRALAMLDARVRFMIKDLGDREPLLTAVRAAARTAATA